MVASPVPGDPYWLEPPARPFAAEVEADPGVLRIAFTTQALASDALDPECAEAVRDAAGLCESLGHQVEEASLPGDFAAVTAAAGVVVAASVAAMLDTEAARRGGAIAEDEVEDLTWGMYRRGQDVSGPAYIQAMQTAHAFGRQAAAFFEDWDVLLLSTLGSPPSLKGARRRAPPQLKGAARPLAFLPPNPSPSNLTGPAATGLASPGGGRPARLRVACGGAAAAAASLFAWGGGRGGGGPWEGGEPRGGVWVEVEGPAPAAPKRVRPPPRTRRFPG